MVLKTIYCKLKTADTCNAIIIIASKLPWGRRSKNF